MKDIYINTKNKKEVFDMTMTTAVKNETRNPFLLKYSKERSTNHINVLNEIYQINGVTRATKYCYIYYFDSPSQEGHKW